MVAATRVIVRRPSPGLAVALYVREAQALARLGDATASARALDRAAESLAVGTNVSDPVIDPLPNNVDEDWLDVSSGTAWLDLRRPKKALSHFTALLDDGSPSRTPALSSPYAARRLLYVVDAQLALGELDAATPSAHRAVALVGSMTPGLARKFRQRFTPCSAEPAVRDLMGHFLTSHAAS
ncbi:hypothetical protein ABZ769_15355 [Streptomyces olivoreticuli]